jgi:dienelactone hydrolase
MEDANLKKKSGPVTFSRRKFINITSVAGLYGFFMNNAAAAKLSYPFRSNPGYNIIGTAGNDSGDINLIGDFGSWAAGKMEKTLPSLSFRRREWRKIEAWRKASRKRTEERLAMPNLGNDVPEVKIHNQYNYDGLHIEELSWQLPYGRPTEAILLKPARASGKLPGILAFHDHAANKYFGTRKITRTGTSRHPMMEAHQRDYYDNFAWANEIAKKGYVVLVSDAFPFASRRVMMQDVPERLRQGLTDKDPENQVNIDAYNRWAANHEHTMAKSLFCAGTTWPGVFLAEDKKALDVLCARKEVDAQRVGCGGLSGGGMRTVFLTGLDSRIKCAVCVGFMTTWKELVLNNSVDHTWMTYVPLLPNELDFPEILGLAAPAPVLVINANEDELFTLQGMKSADGILKEVYKKADAADRYKGSFYPGGHKFDSGMQTEAFNWFDRWLK